MFKHLDDQLLAGFAPLGITGSPDNPVTGGWPGHTEFPAKEGTIGQAPACIITSGISHRACISTMRPFSNR